MRSLIPLLVLALLGPARAQDPGEIGGPATDTDPLRAATLAADLAEAYDRLEPGRTVQLTLDDGTTTTGRVAGWDGRRIHLLRDGEPETIDGRDVRAMWVRKRATRTGLLAGAVLGGLGGGAFMTLMGVYLNSMDDDGAPVLPLTVGGLLAGGLGGGLVGAGVGSALPDWELVYATPGAATDRPPAAPPALDTDTRIGSVSLLAGAARNGNVVNNHTDFAWRLGLLADRGDHLSYGVEFGRYLTGPAHHTWAPHPEPDISTAVWHAGGVLQARLPVGPTTPYLAGGLAYYDWDDSFLGWNVGAGLSWRLTAGAEWICEYRHHANLQRLGETEPRLATFMAGVSVAW